MKTTQIIAVGLMIVLIIAVITGAVWFLGSGKGTTTGTTTTVNPAFVNKYNITIIEYKFSPANLTVGAGSNIQLRVNNQGTFGHNLFISGLNVGTQILAPNTIGFVNFTSIPKGNYIVTSQVDGDAALGLNMNLTAK